MSLPHVIKTITLRFPSSRGEILCHTSLTLRSMVWFPDVMQELVECQGPAVDVGGYYKPDASKATAAMRPSAVYNAIIDGAKWVRVLLWVWLDCACNRIVF